MPYSLDFSVKSSIATQTLQPEFFKQPVLMNARITYVVYKQGTGEIIRDTAMGVIVQSILRVLLYAKSRQVLRSSKCLDVSWTTYSTSCSTVFI